MLALARRSDRRRATIIMVLVILLAGVTAATAFSQRWLVDSAGMGTTSGVLAAVALGVGAYTLAAAGNRLMNNLRIDLTERVDLQVNQEILTTTASIPTIEHLERPEYLDRLARLRRSTVALAGACWSVMETVAAVLSLSLTLWLLATVHPVLTGAALLAIPPLYLANRGRRIVQRVTDQTAELERVETELHDLCINPDHAKEVRISGDGRWLNEHADRLWAEVLRRRARAHAHAAALQLAGWASYAIGFVAALAVVAQLVIDQRATVGEIVMVITLATQLRFTIGQTVDGITQLGHAGHVIGHYQWLDDYADSRQATGRDQAPQRLTDGIMLQGVGFAYPGTDRPVLTAIDLHLPAGRTVALVGINGAGKTTLVKLLAGLYQPTYGTISVDGVPLPEIDPVSWRQRITGTFQDFMKFQLTARHTVGVGDLLDLDNDDAVHRAVTDAGASPVIDGLTDRLDTQLGRVFDGTELSQGQWQKLALARGHMRQHPLLLVLDEPTAALDPQAEHDLYERFTSQARTLADCDGCIALLVSHRFSTVRMADLIIVLEDGHITEVGSHAQLIAAGGAYAQHYRTQARGYTQEVI
jgi:ATP-binding cassette subfamily B protein